MLFKASLQPSVKRKIRSAYKDLTRFGGRGHLGEDLKLVEIYDGEIDFYEREFRKADGVGAEFAAGALRVSIPLVRAGHTVFAIEASEAMRTIGKKAMDLHLLETEKRRLHVIPGDMRRAQLPIKVSLVIIPYQSFWFNFGRGFKSFCACGETSLVMAAHALECHARKRTYFSALLSAEYCVRSMLEALVPQGKFIVDAPATRIYRGWWDWVAERYNFSYEISRPYSCKTCLPDVRLGALCLHSYDKKVFPEGYREVLVGTKLD